MYDPLHVAARRQESRPRILGVDPNLDRVACQGDVLLRERQGLARGDAQLQLDEVEARDELRDRMLDLQARVHLHEEELVRRITGNDELDRSRADIADTSGRLAGRRADACAGGLIEQRRGRFFDDLLVPPLQRALALAEVHDVPVRIGDDLHLDVPRAGDVPLEKERVVAEGCRGFPPRRGNGGGDVCVALDDVHAFAAAARGGLDEHGEADSRGARDQLLVGEAGPCEPGHRGHAPGLDCPLGGDLVAHDLDRLGARADEHDPRVGARTCELRILGEEAETRVDRVGARATRGIQHPLDRQVALRSRSGPEPHGFVGEAHVHGAGVGVAVDRDRADADAAECADDAHRDLAAVGDEDLRDDGSVDRGHGDHIRKTP